MNDIHAIIAAAKGPHDGHSLTERECRRCRAWYILTNQSVAMAEALLRISDMPFADYKAGINVQQYWIDECGQRIRIARDALAAIVKEAT